MNGYENFLEMCAEQINSVESYRLMMQHMFADGVFNRGRIEVWFYVTQNVYERLPVHERERCHELVLEWFSVFEKKWSGSHVEHMRITWDEFPHQNILS